MMMKLYYFIFMIWSISMLGQDSIPKIKHEIDFGGTGQFHFDGTGLRYSNFFKEPYILGGRKRGHFILLITPRFCFNYHRHVNDYVYSIGFLFYRFNKEKKEYIRQLGYMALNLGFEYKNLLSSKKITFRPKFTLQINNSVDSKLNPITGVPIAFSSSTYDFNVTPGLGFNLKYYFYKKFFLTNDVLYMFHLKPENYFIQHNIGLGYRF